MPPAESTIARYRDQILRLLPPGKLRLFDEGNIHALVEACSVEPARIHERVEDLLREATPSRTSEMLADWEEALGLPDDCVQPTTMEDRVAAVVARFVGDGGHSTPEYLALARALGFDDATFTFEHFDAFRVGDSRVGDWLSNEEWPWVVKIRAQSLGPTRDALLRCAFNARRRGHSLFLFVLFEHYLAIDGDRLTIDGGHLVI